jgi:c-di-GMP-binding flagellar brake protein YcgR
LIETAVDETAKQRMADDRADDKQERRAGPRTPVQVPVSVKTPAQPTAANGVTRDLSAGGVFLYTDSSIAEGSELEMVLILPPEITKSEKQWVCCQASVVRVEKGGEEGSFGVAASIRSMDILPEIPS